MTNEDFLHIIEKLDRLLDILDIALHHYVESTTQWNCIRVWMGNVREWKKFAEVKEHEHMWPTLMKIANILYKKYQ